MCMLRNTKQLCGSSNDASGTLQCFSRKTIYTLQHVLKGTCLSGRKHRLKNAVTFNLRRFEISASCNLLFSAFSDLFAANHQKSCEFFWHSWTIILKFHREASQNLPWFTRKFCAGKFVWIASKAETNTNIVLEQTTNALRWHNTCTNAITILNTPRVNRSTL
jgi:hypothetical protein